MRILAQTGDKPNWMFGTLPQYFKENDNYVPNSVVGYENIGLLERYLECFCQETDNEVTPYIDAIGYLFDATGLDNIPGDNQDRFLIHLSDILLNPEWVGTDEKYKVLLRYLVEILQRRGSLEGLKLYLALLGYKISTFTSTPIETPQYDHTPTLHKYDDGLLYDNKGVYYFYVDIVITDYDGIINSPTAQFLLDLKEALQTFMMPVVCEITSLTYI